MRAPLTVDPLEPVDLSHLSDEDFEALCPQGYHAPVAPGPTDEEILYLSQCHEVSYATSDYSVKDAVLCFAHDLLRRHGCPVVEPVSVSERLPGAEDCDADGFCWWFSAADPAVGPFGVAACWILRKHEPDDNGWRTHWLPYWALPLLTTTDTP